MHGSFEKGDEVILLEPFYPYHVITLKALGINPVTCNYSDDEFTLIDFELIADKISTRTKAILICTPVIRRERYCQNLNSICLPKSVPNMIYILFRTRYMSILLMKKDLSIPPSFNT